MEINVHIAKSGLNPDFALWTLMEITEIYSHRKIKRQITYSGGQKG